MKERIESKDATLFFDITDHDLEGYNKFVPYYLHPESIYSVGPEQEQLSRESFRGLESLGAFRADRQSGQGLRTLRRRGPRPGWGHLLRRYRGGSCPKSLARNRWKNCAQQCGKPAEHCTVILSVERRFRKAKRHSKSRDPYPLHPQESQREFFDTISSASAFEMKEILHSTCPFASEWTTSAQDDRYKQILAR